MGENMVERQAGSPAIGENGSWTRIRNVRTKQGENHETEQRSRLGTGLAENTETHLDKDARGV